MKIRRFILIILAALSLLISSACSNSEDMPAYWLNDASRVYAAHAGGVYDGYMGTNSLEAIIESVELGYKLIEVDLVTTSDNRYVLNHDWESMGNRVAFADNNAVDLETFMEYKIYNKFTPMTLEDLIDFLDEHQDILIITDTKDESYAVLRYIKKYYKKYINRFIPQVYAFKDYRTVKRMGFKNVIITLYSMAYNIKSDPDYIYKQAKKLKPYAIAVPESMLSDEYISKLRPDEIKYFVHTVNDSDKADELFDKGIYGVYTDTLLTDNYREMYDKKASDMNEEISKLPPEQKSLLNDCLIYRYGSELCITDGEAALIYKNELLVPLRDENNIYLPVLKTAIYMGCDDYAYIHEELMIVFEYKGKSYKAGKARSSQEGERSDLDETVVVYCDVYYCTADFFADIFKLKIAEENGYIIISRDETKDISRIVEVLEQGIFSYIK